jgi:hypothetical protein
MSKNVSKEHAFWFCNRHGWVGQIAHSLDEFANQVKVVPIESLEFHLRDGRNDFEAWLVNVMQEKRLAKRAAKIKKEGFRGEDLRKALIGLFE